MLESSKDKRKVIDEKRPLDKVEMPHDGIKEVSNIASNPERTTVVDTQRIPKLSLMANISGSSWPVDYAHNLVSTNDVSRLLDWEVDNPTQQFEMIYGLELRVNSPLSRNQDDKKKTFEITGEATLMHSIVPLVNDTFFADMGDGEWAVFKVNSVRRASESKIATYIITYSLRFQKRLSEIKALKPVREYWFVKERLGYGADPLLTKEEYNYYLRRGNCISAIVDMYPRRFYDTVCQTLRIPIDNSTLKYYDVFLTMFVRDLGIHLPGKDFVLYPHGQFINRDIENVLKVIIDCNPSMLPYVPREMVPYNVRSFRTGQTYNNIAWSKFDATVFPKDLLEDVNRCGCPLPQPDDVWVDFESDEVPYRGNENEKLPWFVKPSFNPYLFSEHFYEGGFASVMEYCVYLLLNRKPIQLDKGVRLFDECLKLPKIAQFYYMPIVYAILVASR